MWRKLRRRTMAPGRPALYGDQLGLVLIVLAMVLFGLYVAFRAL